ncbi:MAG: hypothetical protein KJS97_16570, partial [Alphaproteobacteria bacterium]|nr:hypothetical protein [Alphaproteobacteria bacterium]
AAVAATAAAAAIPAAAAAITAASAAAEAAAAATTEVAAAAAAELGLTPAAAPTATAILVFVLAEIVVEIVVEAHVPYPKRGDVPDAIPRAGFDVVLSMDRGEVSRRTLRNYALRRQRAGLPLAYAGFVAGWQGEKAP